MMMMMSDDDDDDEDDDDDDDDDEDEDDDDDDDDDDIHDSYYTNILLLHYTSYEATSQTYTYNTTFECSPEHKQFTASPSFILPTLLCMWVSILDDLPIESCAGSHGFSLLI